MPLPDPPDAADRAPDAANRAPDAVDPVLERLQRLHPKAIDLSLDRVRRLLAALGDPQERLPPVVHVAGTNGKGSTIAFMRACLEAAGYRVHVYTSPHLVRFHERIRVAGRLIADDALIALLEECERANGGQPITFFEITTAAAFLAFAREPADAVLLETGLGGLLDATNVVSRPAVTAITRISYDHMGFLGPTLTGIAREKAGILKRGVPLVLAPQPAAEAANTVLSRALAVGAPISPWSIKRLTGGGFHFASRRRSLELPPPSLTGAHQVINAGQAVACLDALAGLANVPDFAVEDDALIRGLAAVSWPARLQRLTRGPLVARLPAGWEIWLDGGHNDSAGEVLAVQAATWSTAFPKLPLALVVGMLASKRPLDLLTPLARHASILSAVPISGEHSTLTAAQVAEAAGMAGIRNAETADNPTAALDSMIQRVPGPCRVLICGSFYLAGSILAENG
ncbi:MAG: folylpolyglutamate synthase/dihydrofolate synthase family protein [Rhodospirillaceae bacterium]